MSALVAETIEACRATLDQVRSGGRSIGFVPTMGALHGGHLSLVDRARERADAVVVSIFVNPTQFDAPEDLEAYPRDLEGDLDRLSERGVELVFAPSVKEMYPHPSATRVTMDGPASGLEAVHRPGHFDGVLMVVAKLFNIVRPDVVVFGQKDAQQAAVVKRMIADLDVPVALEIAPTVRDPDGLACSSRNVRLSPAEREQALGLARALSRARERFATGETDARRLEAAMRETLAGHPDLTVDYAAVVDERRFEPIDTVERRAVAAVAGRVGSTRLIDNVVLDPEMPAPGVDAD